MRSCDFEVSWFFKFLIEEPAVAEENLSLPVLGSLELIVLINIDDVLVSGEGQENLLPLILAGGWGGPGWHEHFEGLLVLFDEGLWGLPDERHVLSGEELPRVGPSSQVNLFGVDLVGDVDKKDVEVVV